MSNLFDRLVEDPSTDVAPEPETLFDRLAATPDAEVADEAVRSATADAPIRPTLFDHLATRSEIENPPAPEAPPTTTDVLTDLRQRGFDAVVDRPDVLARAVDVDMARWGNQHPWLAGPTPEQVPLVAGTLRRYFLTARALRAVPAAPGDLPEGDWQRALSGAIDKGVVEGDLDLVGARALGALPPATLRAAISWLQTPDAEPPEAVRPAFDVLRATAARTLERNFAEARASGEEVDEPGPARRESGKRGVINRWIRHYADSARNLGYLRRLERAGVIDPGAVERYPVAKLADLPDVPDPVEFAPSMALMRHLGATIAPTRPEPPGERIAAAEAAWRQAVAETAQAVPDRALRGFLAEALQPIGEALMFVKEAVVDTDVAALKTLVGGVPFDPEAERIRSGLYFARGQAVLAKALGQNDLYYDIVNRMRAGAETPDKMAFVDEVANWGGVWDQAVDASGIRQWVGAKFGPAGVMVADALDLIVSMPVIGVMPEDSGSAILNLGAEALAPLAFRHSLPGLATRLDWAGQVLLAQRRNPLTWRALQSLGDDVGHLGLTAQRAIGARVATRTLQAARVAEDRATTLLAQYKGRTLLGRAFHGGEYLRAMADRAKAAVLRKAGAVARRLPTDWRPAFEALGQVDPGRALAAADPHGWLTTGTAQRFLGAFDATDLADLAARRGTALERTLAGEEPPLVAELGVPGGVGADLFALRALEVATDGGTLDDLYGMAADYQARSVADLRRRVRAAVGVVGADVARPLRDEWRTEAARLRALTSEHRALRDTLKDPVRALKGARGGKVLWEVVDDDFAEVVAGVSPRFGTALGALRRRATEAVEHGLVKPAAREFKVAERLVTQTAAGHARTPRLLTTVRARLDALPAAPRPEQAGRCIFSGSASAEVRLPGTERDHQVLDRREERIRELVHWLPRPAQTFLRLHQLRIPGEPVRHETDVRVVLADRGVRGQVGGAEVARMGHLEVGPALLRQLAERGGLVALTEFLMTARGAPLTFTM